MNGALGYACQCPSYATGTNCQNVPPCPCAGDPSWFIANSAPEAVCIVAYVTPTIYEYALANTSGGLAVVEPVGALCETSAVSATGLTPAQVQSCANSLLAMDAANGNLCAPCSAPTPACSNVCIDNPGGQYGGSSCN